MFERFAAEARDVVVEAQRQARSAGSPSIDTRHLLLALTHRPGCAITALRSAGVDTGGLADDLRGAITPGGLDGAALASVGIDLNAVRERADAVFGVGALDRPQPRPRRGHTPFTSDAKKALELALREAIRLQDSGIDNRHLLLGLLRDVGSPGERALRTALTAAGSSVDVLRSALEVPRARAF